MIMDGKQTFQIMGSSGMTLGTVGAKSYRQALEAWANLCGYPTFLDYADATRTASAEHDGHFKITLR